MTGAKVLTFAIILSPVLANPPAAAADHGCHSCGCRKLKRVTRLVKTMREIKIPHYQCSPSESFYPEKGTVCHSGFRCDTYYTPHTCWHCQEHRVDKESCEHVVRCVDKGHGNCECSEKHAPKKHVEYEVACTCHGCMSWKTDCGCKTLHGASPRGCFRETWIKQPTGTRSTRVVPEVRWVTMVMCTRCEHSWPCDEIDTWEPPPRAIAAARLSPPQPDTRRVVEFARPFGRGISTQSSARLRLLR